MTLHKVERSYCKSSIKYKYDTLYEALDNAVPHRGDLRPRHVGMWLEKNKGKITSKFQTIKESLQLVRGSRSLQGMTWKVKKLNPPK